MADWRIPLSRPDLNDADRAAVMAVLDSPILSWGEQGAGFESDFSAEDFATATALLGLRYDF